MSAPFLALEARVNHAVFARLANTQAVLAGGAPVSAIWDNGYTLGAVGVAGVATTSPTLTLPTASVPAQPVGATAVVDGTAYLVAEHQPDGSGVSRLLLEAAA